MKKSKILQSIHETVDGLHKAGVMDLKTWQEFKQLCPHPYNLDQFPNAEQLAI